MLDQTAAGASCPFPAVSLSLTKRPSDHGTHGRRRRGPGAFPEPPWLVIPPGHREVPRARDRGVESPYPARAETGVTPVLPRGGPAGGTPAFPGSQPAFGEPPRESPEGDLLESGSRRRSLWLVGVVCLERSRRHMADLRPSRIADGAWRTATPRRDRSATGEHNPECRAPWRSPGHTGCAEVSRPVLLVGGGNHLHPVRHHARNTD